jgi:hypothetical protein
MLKSTQRQLLGALCVGAASYLVASLLYGAAHVLGTPLSEVNLANILSSFQLPLYLGLAAPLCPLTLRYHPVLPNTVLHNEVLLWCLAALLWLAYFSAIFAGLRWASRRNRFQRAAIVGVVILAFAAYAICFLMTMDDYWRAFLAPIIAAGAH